MARPAPLEVEHTADPLGPSPREVVATGAVCVLGALGEISPGDTARLSVRLRKPGRYRIFCTLEGHEAKGMRALLRVKRRQ